MIPKNRFLISSISLAAVLLAAAAYSGDTPFRAGPASQYPHQQSEKVTVGAKTFESDEQIASAFGKKIDFVKYGVLPVLVVIENKREMALDLRALEISLVAADGRHAPPVGPEELLSLSTAGRRPSQNPKVQLPVPLPKKKNPFNTLSIVERAFSAKVLAPGDSANGFLYFEARVETGDKLYLNGMRDARSGQELLYFEFPLAGQTATSGMLRKPAMPGR